MGNVNALALGPGILKTAVLGSAEPVSLVAAWDGAWADLGYTFTGHVFKFTTESEEVEVAEELLPVLEVDVKQVGSVVFTSAEVTATNLQRAQNGGTILTPGGYVTFEPPLPGATGFRMYGWQSSDGSERFVWRKCKNTGDMEINRAKGADKAGIPFELKLLSPGSGIPAWKWWGSTPDRA